MLSLNEFEEWLKKNCKFKSMVHSELKIKGYSSWRAPQFVLHAKYEDGLVTIRSEDNSDSTDQPIIMTGFQGIKLENKNSRPLLPMAEYDNKSKILNDPKVQKLLNSLPKLVITERDIKLCAIYITNKSNLKEFAADMNRIGLVSEVTEYEKQSNFDKKMDQLAKSNPKKHAEIKAKLKEENKTYYDDTTLFVSPMKGGRFLLRYNSDFIATCIAEDYIFNQVKLHGYENWGGPRSSLCYLIGHEILHYRNNHFNPHVTEGIMRLYRRANINVPDDRKKIIDNIAYSQVVPYQELQNNILMSKLLDQDVADTGMAKHTDKSQVFGGYMFLMGKTNNGDYIIRVVCSPTSTANYMSIANGSEDYWSSYSVNNFGSKGNRPICYPIVESAPTDREIFNFTMIILSAYDKNFKVEDLKPKPIVGYQPGDLIVEKKTGRKGIVLSVSGSDIEIYMLPSPMDTVIDKIYNILDENRYNINDVIWKSILVACDGEVSKIRRNDLSALKDHLKHTVKTEEKIIEIKTKIVDILTESKK